MLTLLLYVLIVSLVATLLFLLASAVFGRSEELGPLPEGTTATVLPAEGITGSDVRALRFQQVVRGYKASEVDWALARLAARIDELHTQLAHARAERAAPGSVPPTPAPTDIPENHHTPKGWSSDPTSSSEETTAPGDTTAPTDPSDGPTMSVEQSTGGTHSSPHRLHSAADTAIPQGTAPNGTEAGGFTPNSPTDTGTEPPGMTTNPWTRFLDGPVSTRHPAVAPGAWTGHSDATMVTADAGLEGWSRPHTGAVSREQQ